MNKLEKKTGLKSSWLRFVVIGFFLAAALGMAGCVTDKTKPESQGNAVDQRTPFLVKDQESVLIYFSTTDGKNLVPITLSVKPTPEVAKVAVEKLLGGPEDDFAKPTIPEGTKLKDIYLIGRRAYLDLTPEIKKVSPAQAEMAVSSLLFTLTEFKEVDDVQILIDGHVEEKLGNVAIGKPLPRPEEINAYGGAGDYPVRVFFSDSNAMYLVPLTFHISGENAERQALDRLLEGPPAKSGLFRTVWQGTKVKDFQIKDGTAIVDLSKEALGYGGGTSAEMMFVNSVVWTLTAFDGVDSVQFLFEGEKIQYLPEGTDVSSPIYGTQRINWIQ